MHTPHEHQHHGSAGGRQHGHGDGHDCCAGAPTAGVPAAGLAEGTIYTCPMHPEVRQDHPGNCPKCGMALEPLMPASRKTRTPSWSLPPPLLVDAAASRSRSPCWRCSAIGWAGSTWPCRAGSSSCSRCRSCCGQAGRSSCAGCNRRQPQPEHVDADRPGHRGGVRLQRRRHDGARRVSGVVRVDGTGRGLLRSGRRHHLADPSRPVARAQGAFADVGRDQVAARPGAEDGAPHPCRRHARKTSR